MKTIFKEFRISSVYKGDKCWQHSSVVNYNNHIITITNTLTNKRTCFEFWMSVAYPVIETKQDLLQAFQCFLEDALAVIQTEDQWDFFKEFGYTPNRESYEIYNACKRSATKAKRVVGNEQRLCDLVNEINDIAYTQEESA